MMSIQIGGTMPKKFIIAIVVLAVVVAGGVYWFMRKDSNTTTNTSSSSTNTAGQAEVIIYSDGGFSPATLTAKAGDTITVRNTSSHDIQMDSNPHPIHTDDPDLNVGAVAAGQSMNFMVNNKGTFGYHNHLNPAQKGTIVIQ
jgi:plastocyanin